MIRVLREMSEDYKELWISNECGKVQYIDIVNKCRSNEENKKLPCKQCLSVLIKHNILSF